MYLENVTLNMEEYLVTIDDYDVYFKDLEGNHIFAVSIRDIDKVVKFHALLVKENA